MTSSFTKSIVCVALVAAVGTFAQGATIGYWQFNEKSPGEQTTGMPGEILDSSANGHHGYAVGVPLPSYVVGQLDPPSGITLTSKGANDHPDEDRIEVPHDDAFNFNLGAGDDYTLEAIIRTTEGGAIVTKRNYVPSVGGPGYNMAVAGGKVTTYIQGTSDFTHPRPESATNVADGNWHHVAVVVDADAAVPDNNVIKFYVDKVLDATLLLKDASYYGTPVAEDLSNTYDVWIGDFCWRAGDQFIGDIDAVRISSGALTPSEFIGAGSQIPGDANGDGKVTDADAAILATNWQQAGGWAQGDFSGDGTITDADAAILATHWQEGVEAAPATPATVPEPSMIVLLAIGGLVLVIRQRCSRVE